VASSLVFCFMTTFILTYSYLFFILLAVFFLPGSALLVISRTWSYWFGLQRYLVAVGLSLAFYPVLFYAVRFLLPQAVLGPAVMGGLLLATAVITLWGIWQHRLFPLQLSSLEWAAVVVLGLTFASRLWFIYRYSFPAWSDSLHHTLLTQLVAENGRLPTTLEPYFPNLLDMYHLGLYAISGTVAMLTPVPAHTALLWTAQFLNALCGIGLYLVLDRYAGRTGAVVGLALAGLFSAHPALWVNWGRFTQLSSQVIMLFAWLFTLESLRLAARGAEQCKRLSLWLVVFSALSTAALFLFHFRVAIFYVLLLLPSLFVVFRQATNRVARRRTLKRLLAIGTAALLLVLPVLWAAANLYFSTRLASRPPLAPEQAQQLAQNYYIFPLSTLPYLAAPVWLLALGALAGLIGLFRRNWLIAVTLVWLILLIVVGNLYLLNIRVLNVTNFGAVLIMFYLPLALLVGAAVEEIRPFIPTTYQSWFTKGLVGLLLLASLPAAYARATTVEAYRHFVTPADMVAMTWIETNVPAEARFAINTYFWLPTFAHGTDAGYWLPYFTGHRIVTSSMLNDGLTREYRRQVLHRSEASEALKTDLGALDELHQLGVTHIYIGARGNFAGAGLQRDFLLLSDRVELLYEYEGAVVLRITP
jgi:hypothetical protein